MTLNEVADLIDSRNAELLRWGNYLNRRGVRGYYMQMKCGDHWCKISVSDADRHADRITVNELDEIGADVQEDTTKIPRISISFALRTAGHLEEVAVNRYLNSAGVEGIWSEFYFESNWYMVSVSHIDVPVYAALDELERIADEFLRQQGHKAKRHRDR